MTTANKITILRILLIPLFVMEVLYYSQDGSEVHRFLAVLCFAVASILDGVDGYIARRYNQRSELGAILDPLADKLLLVSAIVLLSFDHRPYLDKVPPWLTVTIIGRDILLLTGLIVLQMMVGKFTVRPRILGKIATVLQMVVVLWILLQWGQRWLPVWTIGAAVCTGVSGLFYVWDWTRQVSAHPSSSPKSKVQSLKSNVREPQTLMAKSIELKLKEGDLAPGFTANASGGGKLSLSDFKGKNVILYFYPRDDTPGCTKEACAFRDEFAAFKKKGAVVLGVSTDSAKSHDKFAGKYRLPFTLMSDEDKQIVQAYGAWGEKSFLGRRYQGTYRVTFLIGPDGRIKKIWPVVKPAEHAKEVLAAL